MRQFHSLVIPNPGELVFGYAPYPVKTRRGLTIGNKAVYPELNFTLPPIEIIDTTFHEIKEVYKSIVEDACKRAVGLNCEGIVIEFEALIEMTLKPEYSIEITEVINDILEKYWNGFQLKSAIRITPNDTRHKIRPPKMRSGKLLEDILISFEKCALAGAEFLSIESTGGKEVFDEAILACDVEQVLFSLAVLGTRDMAFLWENITEIADKTGAVPAGDTACGFGNTAMVLAEKNYIPRVFSALVRAMSIPRSLVAYEKGAVGPGKDCGYENPFLKVITGFPISMEGKTAACAHSSPLGNIAACTCDLWSNESVQNIRLLGGMAPTICLEQLIYDCRLMNQAIEKGMALQFRDILVDSDKNYDPQAIILAPENVVRIANSVISENDYYSQTKAAATVALSIIQEAYQNRELAISTRELPWMERVKENLLILPNTEDEFIDRVLPKLDHTKFVMEEYNL